MTTIKSANIYVIFPRQSAGNIFFLDQFSYQFTADFRRSISQTYADEELQNLATIKSATICAIFPRQSAGNIFFLDQFSYQFTADFRRSISQTYADEELQNLATIKSATICAIFPRQSAGNIFLFYYHTSANYSFAKLGNLKFIILLAQTSNR
ncbi:hypothetical protein [Algoriphagus aquimarinus]|uniref:hypothetical protein n=1 Tax=Algoriphagus aquimarinus TaxID=237018 RepID=UPI0030DD9327